MLGSKSESKPSTKQDYGRLLRQLLVKNRIGLTFHEFYSISSFGRYGVLKRGNDYHVYSVDVDKKRSEVAILHCTCKGMARSLQLKGDFSKLMGEEKAAKQHDIVESLRDSLNK